jgi:hypothetical protein
VTPPTRGPHDASRHRILESQYPGTGPQSSLNQMDKPVGNPDGSVDLYFGPNLPRAGKNWLAIVPAKGFWVYLRLYGPGKTFFDQTWKRATSRRSNETRITDPARHPEDAQTLRRCSSLFVSTFALSERLRGLPSGSKCRRCS